MLHGGLRGEFEEYTRSSVLHTCLDHKSWRETHVPKVPSSHSPASPRRLLHLATTAYAIILSPDYRHIPESTISDILADVQDFFTWLHASLPTALAAIHPHLPTPALDKIAVAGESAGGYIVSPLPSNPSKQLTPSRPSSPPYSSPTPSPASPSPSPSTAPST